MPLDITDLDKSVEAHLLSDPDDFCEWLLETGWWQQMQDVCTYIHPEFMEQFHAWLGRKFDALPEAERTREDWRVVDLPTLYRALHGFTHWIGAHKRMDSALNDFYQKERPYDAEERVRAAAKELINAALETQPPYRDSMVRQSLVWADFVDRRWLQGLNIPPPWAPKQ